MLFNVDVHESRRGDTLFTVTMEKEDGMIQKKELDLPTFLHLIDASKVVDMNYVALSKDMIPDGYIDGHFASPTNYTCVWEVKGKKRQLVYESTGAGSKPKHYTLPFPNLVFGLSVSNGVKQSFYCFAKKEGDSRLYRYPFGNVSDEGSVCMGSISTKNVTPSIIEDDFFLGITNNDYFGDGMKKCGMKWSQPKLFSELKGKDRFPDNWLVDAECDLQDLLRKYSK